jgi:hypothetical protein
MDKLTRLIIGVFSLVVILFSSNLAYGLAHSPDEGSTPEEVMFGKILLLILCEAAIGVSVASLLGLIWAIFTPLWIGKIFTTVRHHIKHLWVALMAMMVGQIIYVFVLHIILRR